MNIAAVPLRNARLHRWLIAISGLLSGATVALLLH
jgi:hypothetical protein